MDRRTFVKSGIAGGAAAALALTLGQAMAQDDVNSGGAVAELQEAMTAGKVSATSLTAACLARIAKVDKGGPKVNAVIELNPDAAAIAASLDAERAAGKTRGPLHGIPVLLKNNVATTDKMSNSAGSLALDGVGATRDSHIAKRLRDSGVVISARRI